MKKVALVLPEQGLPVPAVLGGAIETLVELLADINEKEKKLDLTIYSRYNADAEKKSKNYKHSKFVYIKDAKGIDKLRYSLGYRLNKANYLGNYYSRVFEDCKKNDFDYIVAEGGHYPAFRKFSKEFGKKKVALHIHHHCKDNDVITGIFGATISVSNFINNAWVESKKDYSEDNDQKNYALINAVDEEKFIKSVSAKEKSELRKKLGFSDEDIVVAYIGRILEVKGVKELVEAVAGLNDPHIRVLVIGSAGFADNPKENYADDVITMIEKNNCGTHLGYVDNKEVYKYAKIADIRCLPSKWEEAGSLALVESLHCGVPLIVTRSGGMPEVVEGAGAIIIDKDERLVDELAQAIKKLAADSTLRQKMVKENLERSKKFRKLEFYNNFVKIIEGEAK